jgi:hypothetical protein
VCYQFSRRNGPAKRVKRVAQRLAAPKLTTDNAERELGQELRKQKIGLECMLDYRRDADRIDREQNSKLCQSLLAQFHVFSSEHDQSDPLSIFRPSKKPHLKSVN